MGQKLDYNLTEVRVTPAETSHFLVPEREDTSCPVRDRPGGTCGILWTV